jgi:hypothetical protein
MNRVRRGGLWCLSRSGRGLFLDLRGESLKRVQQQQPRTSTASKTRRFSGSRSPTSPITALAPGAPRLSQSHALGLMRWRARLVASHCEDLSAFSRCVIPSWLSALAAVSGRQGGKFLARKKRVSRRRNFADVDIDLSVRAFSNITNLKWARFITLHTASLRRRQCATGVFNNDARRGD